jgi:phage shock protein A
LEIGYEMAQEAIDNGDEKFAEKVIRRLELMAVTGR